MQYVGMFILAWLLVGFLVGVKLMFVDQLHKNESFREKLTKGIEPENEKLIQAVLTRKLVFLAIVTLLGFVSLRDELRIIPIKIKLYQKRRKYKKLLKAIEYINKYDQK